MREVIYSGSVQKLDKPEGERPSNRIEFENGSVIESLESGRSVRGYRSKTLFPDIKPLTKPEMWKTLDGKIVKCIYTEDKYSDDQDCCMFAVQDLEDGKVYILDIITE